MYYKKNCKICGFYYRGYGEFYCSRKCMLNDLERKEKQRIKSLGNTNKKGKRFVEYKSISCPNCCAILEVSINSNRKFCSSKCAKFFLAPTICFKNGHKDFTNGKTTGKNHHLWKGGITPINKIIRKSIEYKLWRKAVFERDNYTCQECKIRGSILNPHHIKPFSLYPELRFAIDNGQTLCVECHKKTDTYGFKLLNCTKQIGLPPSQDSS